MLLNNNRGEVLNGEDGTDPNATDTGAGADTGAAVAEPTIDWEAEGNPYKKRYGDSQSQIQPLVNTLRQFAEYDQNTKTWKPKTTQQSTQQQSGKIDELLNGYDPEFVKALDGYTQKQIQRAIKEFREESISTQKYNSAMLDGRNRAITEFGSEFDFAKDGKMNQESPLYKLADEILTSKYVELNGDGTFHKYTNPDAEYLATAEAYALLSKRAKQQQPDKGKLNAIQGKGTKASGVKKNLSFEEYRKLPDAEKDAYDLAQMGG